MVQHEILDQWQCIKYTFLDIECVIIIIIIGSAEALPIYSILCVSDFCER